MKSEDLIAGVAPGGFKDVYEVRILICYLLSHVKEPLTNEQFTIIFEETKLSNYFTFSTAIAQLVNEKQVSLIEKYGKSCYSLNSVGEETAKSLKSSLPPSVREHIVEVTLELLAKDKNERENEVIIEKTDHGYNVRLTIHDTDFDLMEFTLLVPDKTQAEIVRRNFLNSPLDFYKKTIQLLTKS